MSKTEKELAASFAKDLALFLISLVPGGEVLTKTFGKTILTAFDGILTRANDVTFEMALQSICQRVTKEILGQISAEIGSHEFGAHFGGLSDVGRTLAASKLTVDQLIDMDLEPRKLESHLRLFCPLEHKKWASELRERVYERALALTSDYIVLAAPNLPGFSASFCRALLRRMPKHKDDDHE